MAEDINFNDFDYITFVDASGDDGFKFEKDSSFCYTAGCFITEPQDILYNINILNKIKSTAHCKIADEIKHKKIRRHKKRNDLFSYLPKLKGVNLSLNVFKKDLISNPLLKGNYTGNNNKNLAGIAHTFPIYGLEQLGFLNDKKILICIDVMKKIEMDKVENLFKNNVFSDSKVNNYKIIFRDSKAKGYELLQIADLIAGILREFYEITYYNSKEFFSFLKKCRYCRNSPNINMCVKTKDSAVKNKIMNLNIKYLVSNFVTTPVGMYSMFTLPEDYIKYYSMFFCKK